MSLTDSRRMWKLAHERGSEGVHSHELRHLGVSGNPSQRAKDIADHVPFWTKREARNGRPGSRYFVDGTQPQDAVKVVANRDVEGSGGVLATDSPAAALSITPAPEGTTQPVAIFRDYTDPNGRWMELPIDESGWPIEEAA